MYPWHEFCLMCFSGLAEFIMLKGHSIKTTSYFYFSVVNRNSRQCQTCISKTVITISKLKYNDRLWDTLARCSQEVKFHLEQQLNIRTSHKPQRASQTPVELRNERKRWQVCWKIFSLFYIFASFCSVRRMKDGLNIRPSGQCLGNLAVFLLPFLVGK